MFDTKNTLWVITVVLVLLGAVLIVVGTYYYYQTPEYTYETIGTVVDTSNDMGQTCQDGDNCTVGVSYQFDNVNYIEDINVVYSANYVNSFTIWVDPSSPSNISLVPSNTIDTQKWMSMIIAGSVIVGVTVLSYMGYRRWYSYKNKYSPRFFSDVPELV